AEVSRPEIVEQLIPAVSNRAAARHQNGTRQMPRILGVHARVAAGEYAVGFVVLDNQNVVLQTSVPAPGEPEPRQLFELHTRCLEIMGNANAELMVLRLNEAQGKSAQVAHRA